MHSKTSHTYDAARFGEQSVNDGAGFKVPQSVLCTHVLPRSVVRGVFCSEIGGSRQQIASTTQQRGIQTVPHKPQL